MKRRILLLSTSFALVLASLFLGIDRDVGAQTQNQNGPVKTSQDQNLTDAAEQAAMARAAQGLQRSVTNAQRQEAAVRAAARRPAAATAAAKGGANE